MRQFGILLLTLILSLQSCKKEDPQPATLETPLSCNGFPELCNKTLPEVSMVMTHNAFNAAPRYLVPNQDFTITRQLRDGVRGLMIDVYSSPNGPIVYHGLQQTGWERLDAVMGEIFRFLRDNTNEVVVIIFQNSATNEEIMGSVENVGLLPYVYKHGGTWPTLADMIQSNQRLVMMLESSNGNLPEGLLHAWRHTFDTPYTFTNVSDFNCNVNRGGNGLRTFYLVNHWLSSAVGLPDRLRANQSNNFETLMQRVSTCSSEHGSFPNFIGVDFYNIGDVFKVVNTLNGVSAN